MDFMTNARGSTAMQMHGDIALMFLTTSPSLQLSMELYAHATFFLWYPLCFPYIYEKFLCWPFQVLCVHGGLSPDIRTIDQV